MLSWLSAASFLSDVLEVRSWQIAGRQKMKLHVAAGQRGLQQDCMRIKESEEISFAKVFASASSYWMHGDAEVVELSRQFGSPRVIPI